jgi:hypothetical protein
MANSWALQYSLSVFFSHSLNNQTINIIIKVNNFLFYLFHKNNNHKSMLTLKNPSNFRQTLLCAIIA